MWLRKYPFLTDRSENSVDKMAEALVNADVEGPAAKKGLGRVLRFFRVEKEDDYNLFWNSV